MDRPCGWCVHRIHPRVRTHSSETRILNNTAKRKKTKSRTGARPALSRKRRNATASFARTKTVLRRIWSLLAPAAYIIATLVLCQFAAVRFAIGINDPGLEYKGLIPIAQAAASHTLIVPTEKLPLRLQIPRIHVNALIRSVGLTPDGAMGVPSNRFDVAWYNRGPRPGESGSAVIDGHIGFKGGTVFDQLHTLQKGDRLSTVDSQGEVKTFVVRETRIYNFDANVPEVFVSGDGGSHLNLVTCTGVWNKLQKRYNKRLVVFTDLVK